jgi:hypothetical protein
MTGRLLSVNVGRPRQIVWQSKTVRTAIWKESVDGPRMVRRINVEGDDQADRLAHGGEHPAVFVYQLGSYRYWERELGCDDPPTDSSARTSPSRAWRTTRSASATATASAKRWSRSLSRASRATASVSE